MIDRIAVPADILPVGGQGASKPSGAPGNFSDLLSNAIQRVELSGAEASKSVEGFLTGSSGDLHSAALATQRASLQLEYFLQVRNKVVQAYQEIMRMQL